MARGNYFKLRHYRIISSVNYYVMFSHSGKFWLNREKRLLPWKQF